MKSLAIGAWREIGLHRCKLVNMQNCGLADLRAYRFAVAVALLIAAHEIIQQGALLTQKYGYSPYLTIWLPFVLICTFAGWRFWNLCFTVRSDRLEPLFDAIARFFRMLRQSILPQWADRT